jgi:hypothetical protein
MYTVLIGVLTAFPISRVCPLQDLLASQSAQVDREAEIATGNPLLNLAAALGTASPTESLSTVSGGFKVGRRWDDGQSERSSLIASRSSVHQRRILRPDPSANVSLFRSDLQEPSLGYGGQEQEEGVCKRSAAVRLPSYVAHIINLPRRPLPGQLAHAIPLLFVSASFNPGQFMAKFLK